MNMSRLPCLLLLLSLSAVILAAPSCHTRFSEAECTEVATEDQEGCYWCLDTNACTEFEQDCSSTNANRTNTYDDSDKTVEDQIVCRRLNGEENCTAVESCLWCGDREFCGQADRGCSGGEGGGEGEDEDEGDDGEVEGDEEGQGEGEYGEGGEGQYDDGQEGQGGQEGGGSWEDDRPPRRPNVCVPLKNETECVNSASCFWCEDHEVCRPSEEVCPGNGRRNRCRVLSEDLCSAPDSACLWSTDKNRCVSARGHPDKSGGSFDREPRGAGVCPLLASDDDCTAAVKCRWCTDTCQTALKSCDDGTAGERGNPCRLADSEDSCVETDGCLWCGLTNSTSKCRRATNAACWIDDMDEMSGLFTGPCFTIDAQPECNERDECQWCEAQLRCKGSEAKCHAPSGDANLDLGEDSAGSFEIQDDGLGPTDPNAVSVVLSYLYEVTEDGTTIDASLVDLDLQEYDVKQSIDFFFGDIEARQIAFKAVVEGVGTIDMVAYIILSNGTITTPDSEETWDVQEGDIKFNVELKDWTFCGTDSPCGDSTEVSAFLDLALEIRGLSDEPAQSEVDSMLFNLGGNVPLILSSVVEVDGFMQDMPDGFPRLESSEDEGFVFVFRFPTFAESIAYDPLVPYSMSIPVLTDEPPVETPDGPAVNTTNTTTKAPTASPARTIPTKEKGKEEGGLSIGALVGISVGSLLVLGGICAFVGWFVLRRNGDGVGSDTGSDGKGLMTLDDDDDFFKDEEEGRGRHREDEKSIDEIHEVADHHDDDDDSKDDDDDDYDDDSDDDDDDDAATDSDAEDASR